MVTVTSLVFPVEEPTRIAIEHYAQKLAFRDALKSIIQLLPAGVIGPRYQEHSVACGQQPRVKRNSLNGRRIEDGVAEAFSQHIHESEPHLGVQQLRGIGLAPPGAQ